MHNRDDEALSMLETPPPTQMSIQRLGLYR
jgi:hypothetical protein